MMLSTWLAAPGGAFDPRGPAAAEIDQIWWWLLGLGTAVFIAVSAFMVIGLFRPHDEETSGDQDRLVPSKWMFGGGVAMPAVVLAVVFGLSLDSTTDLPRELPDDATVIDVVGNQWWWEVSYEGQSFTTANELHIPVGEPVGIRLTSADVIHSFWVPRLAGKIDALPDGVNTLIIEASEPGTYGGVCAEFCGLQHTNMGIVVFAEPRPEFEAWLARQEAPADVAADDPGLQVFLESGCAECHTIEGTPARGQLGPDLTHVADRSTLAATTLPNTTENLAEWIAQPQEVKPGAQMPDVPLEDGELRQLVSFLETLG